MCTDFVNIFGISINFSGMRASWACFLCFYFGTARHPPKVASREHLRSLCQHGTLEPIKAELPDLARFLLPQMKQHLWLGWKDTPPVSHSLIGQTSINLSQGNYGHFRLGHGTRHDCLLHVNFGEFCRKFDKLHLKFTELAAGLKARSRRQPKRISCWTVVVKRTTISYILFFVFVIL